MKHFRSKWQKTPRWEKIVGFVIIGIIGAVGMGFLFGIVIKLLWNWLMPELFNLKEINYWQAIGLFVLAKLFFGFGGGRDDKSKPHHGKEKHFHSDHGPTSGSNPRNWQYYDEWWEREGKHAFEEFTEKKSNDESFRIEE